MADFILGNGREITFDLDKLTVKEYKAFFNNTSPAGADDTALCKITGITADELGECSIVEYKRLWKKLFKRLGDPLSDPT
jgi:hypothetical protein